MRTTRRLRLPILTEEDLPCPALAQYGFGFYKGVFIQWDEDYDERICTFIDSLQGHRPNLMMACEHEGSLWLIWWIDAPKYYATGTEHECCGDYWQVMESRAAFSLFKEKTVRDERNLKPTTKCKFAGD